MVASATKKNKKDVNGCTSLEYFSDKETLTHFQHLNISNLTTVG